MRLCRHTIQDYHAVCLLLGLIPAGTTSSNAPYYLLGDGIIEHSWFGGAFSHGITYYKIRNGASLAVTESWTFEYNENPAKQYFYSTTSDDYYATPGAFRSVLYTKRECQIWRPADDPVYSCFLTYLA